MATFFLVVIYLSFISLGLPDSLLGSAWPVMQGDLGAPMSAAGMVSMIISAGTILSSLSSAALLKRFGTGRVTFVSVLMTAAALLGFSCSPSLGWLLLLAVPLGLGAGAVDAGLNAFVATHYAARHMSWLHCFWGVGATLGPIIMAQFLPGASSWRGGYRAISVIQFALVAVLFFTLPLWKRFSGAAQEEAPDLPGGAPSAAHSPFAIPGVKFALASFLFYCGAELTVGLWGSSFLVERKGLPADTAARWVSLYYAGITVGRLVTGFVTAKVSSKALIRAGQVTVLAGAALLLLPLPAACSLAAFILIGMGCAPIYPCMLHETPARFGKENAARIMGLQMAFAYIGSTALPPVLGWAASLAGLGLFPWFVAVFAVLMLLASERINAMMAARAARPGA